MSYMGSGALPVEDSGVQLRADELLRAGAGYRVACFAYDEGALAGALRELLRHVRPFSLFGTLPQTIGPELVRGVDYYWVQVHGSTYRAAGSEFTVGQLRTALGTAYRLAGGTGVMTCVVTRDAGDFADAVTSGPAALTTTAEPVVAGVGRVGGAVVRATEGAAGGIEGAGALLGGAGEGAAAVGGFLGGSPLLAFGVVVAIGLGVVWWRAQ